MSSNIQNLYLNLIVKKTHQSLERLVLFELALLSLLTVTPVPKTELYI